MGRLFCGGLLDSACVRAYVVSSHRRIAPFGELARDLPVANVPLSEWTGRLFAKFGIEVKCVDTLDEIREEQPFLLTYDNVFFTRRVLKSFLERWKKAGFRASRLALPANSSFIRQFSALQDHALTAEHACFNFWGLPKGTAVPSDMASAPPLEILYKEKLIDYRVPGHLVGFHEWQHPVTSSICFHVRHWLHLLQINRLAIQIRWVDEVVAHPIWAAFALLRGLIPGRGRMLWRIGASANRIGKNVDIHPTARIEGSFIGDNVRIGPQSLVRAAIIGEGSLLEERVNILSSVVGPRSFVSKNSVVYASASMEEANLGMSGMQMCLAGRRAALTPRATPTDVLPGRKLKVKLDGQLVEIDIPLLGSCFGHDTYIGADLYIAPGREVPNGVRIGPTPERVLSSIPDDADPNLAYTVRDGRLVER
jgi:acetyltransferase-like isoleucine patch superfamily enzyme